MSKVTCVVRDIPVPPVTPEREVVLTMPWKTAVLLQSLLGAVGGDPNMTYRKETDEVYGVLAKEGISSLGFRAAFTGVLWAQPRA